MAAGIGGYYKVPYALATTGFTPQATRLLTWVRVNHLIYSGFAINMCLQNSPGGMIDMARYGIMRSVLRDAVTAVENKETAEDELAKEIALWLVAVNAGFVFDVESLVAALTASDSPTAG